MIGDIWLVASKEFREVLFRQGGSKASWLNFVLVIGVFGIFMPVQAGVMWVQRPWLLFAWTWLPLFMVSALVADSFAGERERHTLETLLTTPLSDRAILFGKIGAAVMYGYGMLLLVMVVSLVTVNVVYGTWKYLLLFEPGVFAGVFVFGLLGTTLIAAIGVMISLKAKTVRQAGQTLSLGILALVWLPGIAAGYVYQALSESRRELVIEWLSTLDPSAVAAVAALGLLLLDIVFVGIAMRRFRRSALTFE